MSYRDRKRLTDGLRKIESQYGPRANRSRRWPKAVSGNDVRIGQAKLPSGTYTTLASWSTATSNKWSFQLGTATFSSSIGFTADDPAEYVEAWNLGSGYIANGTLAELFQIGDEYFCNVQGTRKVSGVLAAPLGSGGTGFVGGVQISDSDLIIPTGWRLPSGTHASAWWDGNYFTLVSYQTCPEVEE